MKWIVVGLLTGAALWFLKRQHAKHVDDLRCQGGAWAYREYWRRLSNERAGIDEDAA